MVGAADEISGIVKNDLDNDGIDDGAGEPLLAGVSVILWEDLDNDGVFEPTGADAPSIRTSISSALGAWSFTTNADFNNNRRYFVSIGAGHTATGAFACTIRVGQGLSRRA